MKQSWMLFLMKKIIMKIISFYQKKCVPIMKITIFSMLI